MTVISGEASGVRFQQEAGVKDAQKNRRLCAYALLSK
jgi:hypothetical protein